jgi:Tfp pilus assembly protein PilN
MGDISLLPEDLRGQEQRVKVPPAVPSHDETGGLKMHVPDAMVDEDIEIIEVDEGDLAAVLSEEPFMTRFTYQLSLWFDQIKDRFFKHEEEATPAKAPPQFFRPPRKGLVSSATPGKAVTPGEASGTIISGGATTPAAANRVGGGDRKPGVHARITPQTEVPRRVRVIKRVRKPVRVSLVSAEDLAVLSIDIGKRKWTLGIFIILFTAMIVGGYVLISSRLNTSKTRLAGLQNEVSQMNKTAEDQLAQWKQYEDLEGRLKLLQQALGDHIMITRLFDFLEKNTLKGVSYKTASWSGDGQLTLDVVAESFDDAGAQMIILKQSPLVQSAESSGFSMSKNGTTGEIENITFQLALKLAPESLRGLGLETDADASAASSTSATSQTSSTQP